MDNANLKELIALDLDGSDNLTEDILFKFISKYGPQMQGSISYVLKSDDFLKITYLTLISYIQFHPHVS